MFTLQNPTTCEKIQGLNGSISGVFQNCPIVIRSQFGFQRFGNSVDQIQRFIPISGGAGPFEICLRSAQKKTLKVKMYIDRGLELGSRTGLFTIGESEIPVLFDTNGIGEIDGLIGDSSNLMIHSGKTKLVKIEVEEIDSQPIANRQQFRQIDKRSLNVKAVSACHVTIANSAGTSVLVLSKGETLTYEHIAGNNQLLEFSERKIELPWGDSRFQKVTKISVDPPASNEQLLCENPRNNIL